MRRRQVAEPEPAGTVPPELAIGRCAEVWAADGRHLIHAWGNYSRARAAWQVEQRLPNRTVYRLLPGSSPWSVQALIATGRGDEARERFARHGVTLDQLPKLRAAAQRRIANIEGGQG